MGFDPITLALAKAYTDSKTEGGGGGLPVVVDLDSYGLGVAILQFVQQGGGVGVQSEMGKFWDDISNRDNLRLKMAYDEYFFAIDQCARMYIGDGNVACQLSFALLLVTESGETTNVSVAIARNNNNKAVLAVKVS